VIVRFDTQTFPAAFGTEGAEERYALFEAAAALAREGALRVVYEKGVHSDLPKEVRLGPGEVASAYAVGRGFGLTPLADALEDVAHTAEALRVPDAPAWMDEYLTELASELRRGNTARLRTSRPRLKERRTEIRDALAAAAFLSRGEGGMERVISERIFAHSKRFAEVRPWVRTILEAADPRWRDAPPRSSEVLLEHYGMRAKPLFLFCAGGFDFPGRSGPRSLLDDVPSSAIAEGGVPARADAASASGPLTVTTIENETPYHLYVEERGGPAGLRESAEMAVYTGGYPSSVVLDFLIRAARGPEVRFQHWGDPDANGFGIWWLLRSRIGRRVGLMRMDASWVERAAARESQVLAPEEAKSLRAMAASLAEHPDAAAPDVSAAGAAIRAVLAAGKWIEQERHYSTWGTAA
jgi:hypothetical protein